MTESNLCIHGVKHFDVCGVCSSSRMRSIGIKASEADAALRRMVKLIPQEYWDMMDSAVKVRAERRKEIKKRKKHVILFYILSSLIFFGIVFRYVIVES